MRFKGYIVTIPEGEELGQTVLMKHATPFKLQLDSEGAHRALASVTLNGVHQGDFIIPGHRALILERGTGENGKFTFFAHGTVEAQQAGIVQNHEAGLIEVVFRPASGSVTPKQERISPLISPGNQRCFCSSLPKTTIACGPKILI